MARTVWSDVTLNNTTTDLSAVEPNIASWGIGTLANKQTLAKDEIARRLRQHLAEYKTHINPKEEGDDLVTTASSAAVSSASSLFSDRKVSTSDRLWIKTGSDVGVHTISAIGSNTALTLGANLTTTATGVSFFIEPEVLDLIKNPLILKPAAVFLTLHYCAMELAQQQDQYWDNRMEMYQKKFEETLKMLISDLVLDLDQDHVIQEAERKAGITGGRLLR